MQASRLPPSSTERRIVSILFADLVGFTSLAEGLDPDDLAIVQDAYFAAVRDVLGRYGGQLEKFIGDAAVAVFGVPRSSDDDAERAVAAGLALVHAVGDLGARLGLSGGELRLRVGVNTGEVSVATTGSDAGRVTGDAVNVAARLQAAALPGTVLVGELTSLAVAGALDLEPLEAFALKGKELAVRAARAVAVRPDRSREIAMGRLRSPLLGREAPLSTLSEAAGRAAAGARLRMLVVAPPGVGKTRLLDEAGRRLESSGGWSVAVARIGTRESDPFAPVGRLVRAVLAHGDDRPRVPAGDELARLRLALADSGLPTARAEVVLADVGSLLTSGAESGPGAGASNDRAGRFASWLEALDALEGERPSAWLVEDIHWAGPDVLAFLDAAAAGTDRAGATAGRLIVATARPSILERIATPGSSVAPEPAPWDLLDLPDLEPTDARALVRNLVGDTLPGPLVERLVEHSDGNCLFIEETVRMWVGLGVLRETTSGELQLAMAAGDVPLPATVQAIYAAQLDDLPPPARSAARRCSVGGRRFPGGALQALGVESPGDALETLARRALVAGPRPAPIVGEEYAYRHALLRDAGYASLGRAERAALHVRLADWLVDLQAGPDRSLEDPDVVRGSAGDDLAASIGAHYAAALEAAPSLAPTVGDGRDRSELARSAAAWLERAGLYAARLAGQAAAADHFRRSIELTPEADRLDHARRTRCLGETLATALDLEAGADALERATSLARGALEDEEEPGTAREAARIEMASSAAAWSSARYEQLLFADATRIADEALQAIGDGSRESIALLIARIQGREGTDNAYRVLADEAAAVMALAQRVGGPEERFLARRTQLQMAGNLGEGTAGDWLALRDEAVALGRWRDAVGALLNAAGAAMDADELAAAAPLLEEAAALATAHGLRERLAWAHQSLAELHLQTGDWDRAVGAAEAAIELAERQRLGRVAVRTWFVLTPIAAARGDVARLEQASAWFEAHRESFPGSPYGHLMHAAVDLRLAAFGLIPSTELAWSELAAGLAIGDSAPSGLAAAEEVVAAMAAGGSESAMTLARKRAELAVVPETGIVQASSAFIRSIVAEAEGDRPRARAAAAAALAAAEQAKASWWAARAARRLATLDPSAVEAAARAAELERSLGIPTAATRAQRPVRVG